MKIIQFLRDLFGEKKEIPITQKISATEYQLAIEDFAIQMAINLLAGVISKSEFKTLAAGEPIKKDDYYLWNVEPNVNQNSSQFLAELVAKLIYYNECLVVEQSGQLIIADSFSRKEYALFPNVYSDVSRGEFTFNKVFHENDVLYFSYSNVNIRALLSELLQGYSNLLSMAVSKYKRAGGRKGIVKTSMTPQQNEAWQKALTDLYGSRFKSYFKEENALVVLPSGVEYEEISGEGSKKSTSEVNDIANITKEVFSRVAQAVRIPPALLQGDIADVDSLVDELLTFGVAPVVDIIETEINRKYYGKAAYLNGYQLKIDTTCIKHIDIFSVAEKSDKLISSGMYSIDDLREKIGDTKLNTWWSKRHWMTKNYSDIAAADQDDKTEAQDKGKGGEKNEPNYEIRRNWRIELG